MNKVKQEFTVVDEKIADEIKRETVGRGHIGPRAAALLDGKMIFVQGETGLGGLYTTLRRRNFKVRSRRADGGTYVWAEAIDA